MPFPCCTHDVPLPCRAARGLDCVFPIWFTQCGHVWFTHAMPCPCHAMPRPCHYESDFSRPQRGMGMAWHGMWVTCLRSASSSSHAEFHEGCFRKHINLLYCRTSSLDISGNHADFHEECVTVREWQGNSMVCVNYHGTAWQGNGMGAACRVRSSLYICHRVPQKLLMWNHKSLIFLCLFVYLCEWVIDVRGWFLHV
jgi:hypothetical protein